MPVIKMCHPASDAHNVDSSDRQSEFWYASVSSSENEDILHKNSCQIIDTDSYFFFFSRMK